MEIKIQKGETTTIRLSGQLDTLTSGDLERELAPVLEETAKDIVLDIADLSYISSAGLRLLLVIQKNRAAKQGHFRIIHTRQEIMEIFNLTGFSSILTIE